MLLIAVLGALVVLVLAGGALPLDGIGDALPGTDDEVPGAAGGGVVDLPTPGEVQGPASNATPGDVTPTVVDPVTCEPAGCELWRADIGPGRAVEIEDVLYHAGTSALTAISKDDGRQRWQATLPASMDQIVSVTGGPWLLLAHADGALERRHRESGDIVWRVALPGTVFRAVARDEDVMVYGRVGVPRVGDLSSGFIASIDAATGEPQWLRTNVDPMNTDPRSPLVRLSPEVIGALDPHSGQTTWRHTIADGDDGVDGGQIQFAPGSGYLAIGRNGGVEVIETSDGSMGGRLPVEVPPRGWIDLVGSMLVVTDPVAPIRWSAGRVGQRTPARVTVMDVAALAAAPRSFERVIDLAWLTAGPMAATAGADEVRGLVLLTLDGDAVEIHHLGASGSEVARSRITHDPVSGPVDACCWSLEQDRSGEDILVVPPPGTSEPVRTIGVGGAGRSRFQRPEIPSVAGTSWWFGTTVVTLPAPRTDQPVTVAGGGTRVTLSGDAVPVGDGGPVVLATESGLLAVRPDFLGSER